MLEEWPDMEAHPMEILRIKAVLRLTGLSRTTLWRRVKTGQFPQPLKLGGPESRAVGWQRGVVEEWLASRQPAETLTSSSGEVVA